MSTVSNLGTDGARRPRTFTRVTVVGSRASVDLAVPDDMPMPTVIRSAVGALGEAPGAVWALEQPVGGRIERGATFASLGIRDGSVLNLRHDLGASAPVMVDDVPQTVSEMTDDAGTWNSATARIVGAVLTGGWVILSTGAALVLATQTVAVLVAGAGLLILAGGSILARYRSRDQTAAVMAVFISAPGAALGWSLLPVGTDWAWRAALGCAVAGAAAAVGVLLATDVNPVGRPVMIGAPALGVAFALWALTGRSVMTLEQRSTLLLVASLAATTGLTWAAARTSGLARSADQTAQGRSARLDVVATAARRARWDLFALALVLSAVGAAAGAALAGSADALPVWTGAVGLTALALRGRTYAFPGHVLALAVPALAGSGWVVISATMMHAPGSGWVVVALAGLVLLGFAVFTAGPLAASRVRLFCGRAETVALLVLVPLVLGVWGTYGWVAGLFR